MRNSCLSTLVLVGFLYLSTSIQMANAQFVFGTPELLPSPINSSSGQDISPSISSDGLELYFTSSRPYGWEQLNTWVVKRNSTSEMFGTPQFVTIGRHISIASDGLSLYGNYLGNYGGQDIYIMTRTSTDTDWETPQLLDSNVNSDGNDMWCEISSDGLELYFNRGSEETWLDIYVSRRLDTNEPLGPAVRLPDNINDGTACGPTLSDDGLTMIYTSSRDGGYGDYDLWASTRATKDSPWEEPFNLGPKVNTNLIETAPEISSDGHTLYFTRTTPEPLDYQIWEVAVLDSFNPADFNNDGDIDDDDFHAWETGFGIQIGAHKSDGDADGDGDVDGNDFLVWQQEYGSSSLSLTSTPEPSTLILCSFLAVTAHALLYYRWRHSR